MSTLLLTLIPEGREGAWKSWRVKSDARDRQQSLLHELIRWAVRSNTNDTSCDAVYVAEERAEWCDGEVRIASLSSFSRSGRSLLQYFQRRGYSSKTNHGRSTADEASHLDLGGDGGGGGGGGGGAGR